MAKLMLIGKVAHVELARRNSEDDGSEVIATCNAHPADPACTWERRYWGLVYAVEGATGHADRGEWLS